jgi:hypothetical protein
MSMATDASSRKHPGQETLIARWKRSLVSREGEETEERRRAAAHPVKGWSDTLTTISTGVVAIATLVSWFFGGSHNFPRWFSYLLTVFVLVAAYKYSESHLRRLVRYFAIRLYLRRQRFRLADIIQGFGDLISTKLEDSVTSVLRRIAERNAKGIVETDLFTFPEQSLANILLRLSEAGGTLSAGEFKGVLNDLSVLIRYCSHFYFRKPVQENRLSGLDPAERNGLELARENFVDFVRKFQDFHNEVQLRLGSEKRERFDLPRPL